MTTGGIGGWSRSVRSLLVAIKQLERTAAASSMPFITLSEPDPSLNLLESLAILLIPAALCFTFGTMVGDKRQGSALLAAMLVVLVPYRGGIRVRARGPSALAVGADLTGSAAPGGNMEGKAEVRTGAVCVWAVRTTAARRLVVHARLVDTARSVCLVMMQLERIFVKSFGPLWDACLAIIGRLRGRTHGRPHARYLGKKIRAYEMKMASIAVWRPASRLVGAAQRRPRARPCRCAEPWRARFQ
jgi:K+-transporting ATPase ATPase A chain